MADDYTSDVQTTGTVAPGGSATGEIETADDRDWFAVTLEAGRTYVIDLEGSWTGGGTLRDPFLRGIHDEDGVLIAGTTDDDEGTGLNSRVRFRAGADATYYVAVGAWEDRTGTYSLSVTEVLDDFLAGTWTSGAVAVGASATGDIEAAGDVDWFAVTLEADRTYRIDLKGLSTRDGTLLDPFLHGIHDENGVFIAGTTDDDEGTGLNSRVTFTADEDGTYYVAAGSWGGREGTYTLSVTDITVGTTDDYAAGTGTRGAVAVGGSATGEIETARDVDWFAVTLEADRTYRIDLKGLSTRDGTLSDPYLRGIHDENGVFIAGTTNDDGDGLNSLVTFTADEDGTYYVAAGAWSGMTGTYTLRVTDVTDGITDGIADDFAAGTGTTGTAAVGGSATGEIETAHDRDWFAVTLEADRTYRIDLKGFWTRDGTLFDPYLRGIHDADGAFVAGTTDDDEGTVWNSQVTFTADEGGTYYVAAGAYGRGTGTYTLSVTEVPDDFAAGTGTTGTVIVGASAVGGIDFAGDKDWFAVTLAADTTYRIDLEGDATGAGTLADPYLRGVHDANGALIAGTSNDGGGSGLNSRVTFTADEDGTYYVVAGANLEGEGTYTLSVEEVI